MSYRTARNGLAVLCAAGAAASGLFLAAGPADAKAAVDCKITGITPSGPVAVGPNGRQVTFRVDTTCPAGSKLDWYYLAQYPDNVPNDATFPLYQWANYTVSQAAHFEVNTEGRFTLSSGPSAGNLLAGQPIQTSLTAFVDTGAAGHQDEPYLESFSTPLILLRATRIIDFTADKTTVTSGGEVTFNRTTQRADWETNSWRSFSSHGDVLQFKADGAPGWTTLGDVPYDFPTKSGSYRVRYIGDDWSGASNSQAIHVTVN